MKLKAELDQENPGFEAIQQARLVIPPTNFKSVNKKKVYEQSLHTAATRPKDNMEIDMPKGDIYVYSGQRLNFTEHMKTEILKDMQGRKDAHYTAHPSQSLIVGHLPCSPSTPCF